MTPARCALIVSAVLVGSLGSTLAHAQQPIEFTSYASEVNDLYRRLEELESQVGQYPVQQGSKTCGPVVGVLETPGCPGWIVRADVLYWSVRNPATQYAITDIGGVQDRGAVGQVLTVTPEYDLGFRFSLGRRLGCCDTGPEILFHFTDFDQDLSETFAGPVRSTFISSDNSENDDSDNINTLGVETITPDDRATSARASYRFSYNTYDLELAQSLVTNRNLTLRVGGVGRVMDMDQEFRVTYTGGDFQTAFTPFETSDYTGGGLLLGADLNWHATRCLTLDMGAKAGAMLGTFDTRIFIPDDEPGVPTDVKYNETRMTTVLDVRVGLTYRRYVGRFLLLGSAGYEMTQLLDFNDHRTFSDSHQEGQNSHLVGNISLDGAYCRAGVEF